MTREEFFEWLKTCPAKEEVFTSVITTSEESGYRVIDDFGEVKVCIDMKSYLFLINMEIDYEETMFKSGIKLNVPSVTVSCGCGESVAF